MPNPSTESNDGGRLERAGDKATAQGKNQSNSTATVTVGCKLPHGLYLDLTEPGQPQRRFLVKGRNSAGVIGGYGITEGVPKDFWEEWSHKHRFLDMVKKELIFAYASAASTRDAAKDHAEVQSGFEPIERPAANTEKKPGVIETMTAD